MVSFDYISAAFRFCQQMKIKHNDILNAIDQGSITSPKFVGILQFNYMEFEVKANSDPCPSKIKAKQAACKNGLIQLLHHMKRTNPVLTLEAYGLTDQDLIDYERSLREMPSQTNESNGTAILPGTLNRQKPVQQPTINGKAVFNKPTIASNAGLSSKPASNDPKSPNISAGLFAKAPSSNGFQRTTSAAGKVEENAHAGPVAKNGVCQVAETKQKSPSTLQRIQKEIENSDLNEMLSKMNDYKSSSPDRVNQNGSKSPNESKIVNGSKSPNESKIVNGSNPKTIKDAVGYLKKNQSVFDAIVKLHNENAAISYEALIRRLIKLIPECKYEFNLFGQELGISQLFYKALCVQTVFEQGSGSHLNLKEHCAKKMFYILRLNFM